MHYFSYFWGPELSTFPSTCLIVHLAEWGTKNKQPAQLLKPGFSKELSLITLGLNSLLTDLYFQVISPQKTIWFRAPG